jgi:hypothetical protein
MRMTLLAVLALLFQQVALASYVCSTADVPTANAGMLAHCEDMPMADGQVPVKAAAVLCPAHCTGQVLVTQNASSPTVPPLVMSALLPAPIAIATLPTTHAANSHAAAWRLSGIPPALRFRVLLI